MSDADQDGYTAGMEDLREHRWDIDNVIPPIKFLGKEHEWYVGYQRAYEGRLK